jgi:methylglutaconyl-CoA hydratase
MLVTRADRHGAAVLTLDSPANRNALSRQLVADLDGHLADATSDPAVRVVALTATGNTFCAGADLTDPPVQEGPGSLADVYHRLWTYPKPVLVAVQGHVRAGGLGLVAAADICVASDAATFAFTETRLGLVPAMISVLCLRRMTPAASSRYMLTGEKFGPEEAQAAGLVGQVVPAADLDRALDGEIGRFRECEPGALHITRDLLRRLPTMTVEEGFEYASGVSRDRFGSETAAEGIAAFKEKRPPRWAIREDG